jgi:hypothetical protein
LFGEYAVFHDADGGKELEGDGEKYS